MNENTVERVGEICVTIALLPHHLECLLADKGCDVKLHVKIHMLSDLAARVIEALEMNHQNGGRNMDHHSLLHFDVAVCEGTFEFVRAV